MSRNAKVLFGALTPLAASAALALGLVLSAGALILAAGPAQAFHKGVEHGEGGEGEDIQTLDSLSCAPDQIARWNGTLWVCSNEAGADQQTQLDNLALLASRQASAFVFLSSSVHNGDLDGIVGADLICNNLAIDAGLPGAYKAWLADSDPSSAPLSRFFQAPGPYILPDGSKVADDWADLTDDSLDHAIDTDETGAFAADTLVWTNVRASGEQWVPAPSVTCNDWMDELGEFGLFGNPTRIDGFWSDTENETCDNEFHIYCFGQ